MFVPVERFLPFARGSLYRETKGRCQVKRAFVSVLLLLFHELIHQAVAGLNLPKRHVSTHAPLAREAVSELDIR